MFSPEEIDRYSRHIVLREIGGPGQQKLKAARVLAIGAGGLGSPLLQYLAAAGVGTLGIVDDDAISLSNLQRQTIYSTADIGRAKADCAAEKIKQINPNVTPIAHLMRIDAANALPLIESYDLVVDGSDNFETRYIVSDSCYFARKPLVAGAVGSLDASITTLKPFELSSAGLPNPTYRCLFPEAPPPGSLPTCAEVGVLGALTGIVGSIMALEVVRCIVGFGSPLVGRLLMIDGRDLRCDELVYDWDPDNPLNGRSVADRG